MIPKKKVPRNPYVLPMTLSRKAGKFKDRRKKRSNNPHKNNWEEK